MNKLKKDLFTIGQFAKKAGVTLRTLRYYDKIGLLKPSDHNELGHRLYTLEDFGKLQKILTLKFIGLSLEDIDNIIKYDFDDKDLKKSLEIQKDIIKEKVKHMKSVIKAIEEAENMLDYKNQMNWDKFLNIINVINSDKSWIDQYENASNLRARIKIHENFSTNKEGWMNWFFNNLHIPKECNILELGCGDGSLWVKNYKKIPDKWNITLTDFSEGMLKDAKRNLGKDSARFKFKIVDAQNISFEDFKFDVVIANHMLYHVKDIKKALKEIKRVLKPKGYFFASTIGKNHMKEMRNIISKFSKDGLTSKSWNNTEGFQLENGFKKVSNLFKEVQLKRYNDNLFVTDSVAIMDYIFSMPGNNRKKVSISNLRDIKNYLDYEIENNKGIYITKDTGFFKGRK
ncbi:MerR family transcriptional regulator [Clostridium oceanicum]|uniref:MerR family transcriptional regulator n=1 Tax=Clostridium oceanicum TaxID=1543 RepID=A0ABN1JGC8_9CLOT